MTEGAVADWSAVYLKDVFATTGMATGMGYVVFAMMVSVGRFAGDSAKQRFGAVMLARLCLIFALGGMLLVVTAPVTLLVYLGLASVGLGVSVGFPLAVTAAADLGDRPAAENVAILSFIALLGFLVGPPLIGAIATASSLTAALAVVVFIIRRGMHETDSFKNAQGAPRATARCAARRPTSISACTGSRPASSLVIVLMIAPMPWFRRR